MAGRSVVRVPAAPGRAKLMLDFARPAEIQTDVEVRLNGALLDRFHMGPRRVRKEWIVDGASGGVNTLEITTSKTINLMKLGRGTDDRDFGLQLFAYGWQPLR
jgi:hypothetical protein